MELGLGSPSGQPKKGGARESSFGDYELLGEIGRGGMGVVYKARQVSLNRIVALKMIAAGEFASPKLVERFQIEAEAAAKLEHPNITPIFEVGIHQAQHYFTMKYIDGCNLAAYWRIRFPPDEKFETKTTRERQKVAVGIVTSLAKAIHYAHQRGVLHRDLKPANVLVDNSGAPFLTDFGLAKILEHEINITRTAEVAGTPAYMSPEQANGGDVSASTDSYSLGVILYELLTGRLPFAGANTIEVIKKVISEEPVSPQRINPDLDRDLTTVCLKCLEKDPQRRYDSAATLAEDLQNWQSGRPITARAVSNPERFWRWCRREPALAGSLGSVILLLFAVAIGSSIAFWRIAKAERQQRENLREAYLAQARAMRMSGLPGRRFTSLEVLTKASRIRPGLDLRNEAIASMALPDVRMLKQSTNFREHGAFVTASPACDRYGVATREGAIEIYSLSDDRRLLRINPISGALPHHLSFSDSAKWLAVSYKDKSFRVFELSNGRISWQSPASERFEFGSFVGRTDVLTLKSGTNIRSVDLESADRLRDGALPVTPRGLSFNERCDTMAVFAERSSRVLIVDAVSNEVRRALKHPSMIHSLAWHPDGKRLVVCCQNNGIFLWDTETGEQVSHFADKLDAVRVDVHPGGKVLAGSDWTTTHFWNLESGKEIMSIAIPGRLQFSNAGNLVTVSHWENQYFTLAEVDIAAEVLEVQAGPKPKFLTRSRDETLYAAWAGGNIQLFNRNFQRLEALRGADPVFFDSSHLYCGSSTGLIRRSLPAIALQGTNAPTEAIRLPASLKHVTMLPDGGCFVGVNGDRLDIYDALTLKRLAVSERQTDMTFLACRPDSKLIATGPWQSRRVKVWHARTAKLECTLPSEDVAMLTFSPDGKWLAVRDSLRCRLWKVGTWEEQWRQENAPGENVACAPAFSRDGRLIALRDHGSRVRFIDTVSGTELAAFELHEAPHIDDLCFANEDSLFAMSFGKSPLRVWDLKRVRQRLSTMGLDWESSATTPAK